MSKYRVTYVAVKRQTTYRVQSVHGVQTGQVESIDQQIPFREEKTVEVEADSADEAKDKATSQFGSDVEVNASVYLLPRKGPAA